MIVYTIALVDLGRSMMGNKSLHYNWETVNILDTALGDRAGACVNGKPVCVVSYTRSPEPVFSEWKKINKNRDEDFYVRVGPQTKALPPESAEKVYWHAILKSVGPSLMRLEE